MERGKAPGALWGWTLVDYSRLAVAAVVSGIIFALAWNVYGLLEPMGPVVTRMFSYGLWFIGGPLAASLIRKPLSALLGETLGALVETLLPNPGGYTNLIYGVAQGALSELVYAAFGYKRWDPLVAGLAGAAAAPAAVALDYVLFGEIAVPAVLAAWTVAAAIGGFIYGLAAGAVARAVSG